MNNIDSTMENQMNKSDETSMKVEFEGYKAEAHGPDGTIAVIAGLCVFCMLGAIGAVSSCH